MSALIIEINYIFCIAIKQLIGMEFILKLTKIYLNFFVFAQFVQNIKLRRAVNEWNREVITQNCWMIIGVLKETVDKIVQLRRKIERGENLKCAQLFGGKLWRWKYFRMKLDDENEKDPTEQQFSPKLCGWMVTEFQKQIHYNW